MKKIWSLALSLSFLSLPRFSFANLSGEFKTGSNYYNVGGDRENSFYESESLEYLSELSLDWNENISKDWGVKGSLNLSFPMTEL